MREKLGGATPPHGVPECAVVAVPRRKASRRRFEAESNEDVGDLLVELCDQAADDDTNRLRRRAGELPSPLGTYWPRGVVDYPISPLPSPTNEVEVCCEDVAAELIELCLAAERVGGAQEAH